MDKVKTFLKMHSVVPNNFIDEFLSMNPDDHMVLQTEFTLDLDVIAKWLNVKKGNLLKTLISSYKKDIDFTVVKTSNKTGKYGGNNYKKVMLTPDCFKRLCMLSRSKKAEDVRTYYIELESLIFKYYQQTLDGMNMEIKQMEKAKKNRIPKTGYIYVLKASDQMDSMYKIGRTVNLRQRLASYQTGKLEDIEVVYKYRTDDLQKVESCVKEALKDMRPRKYKEIYKADISLIKAIISKCQSIQNIKQHFVLRKSSQMNGGYYIALFHDD